VAFQRRVRAVGGSCDLIVLPGAPHGLREWARAAPDHEARLVEWLGRALGPGAPAR
jgi:acetyl esterase/lipase